MNIKSITGVIVAACMTGMTAPVLAEQDIAVTLNGGNIDFGSYSGAAPLVKDDRVLIPVRAVAESIGLDVGWQEDTCTVSVSGDGTDIELVIASDIAMVNGENVELDVPAALINDRTYVPLRFVAENCGADVVWDEASQTVVITSKAAGAPLSLVDDTKWNYNAHFDPIMAALLAGTEYGQAYSDDLERKDTAGNKVSVRVDMYNPMYYLNNYYAGAGSTDVAQFWRIRTGIEQGDTALCTEANLALALAAYGADVDFETVWGAAHIKAERSGSSDENFIL